MAWRDSLKRASFRGVPFEVEQHSMSGGRRVASFEYPQRDTPYVEDLGAKQRSFSVDAFVIGSDYMTLRDNLIKALETKGSGVLIHPYLGTMTVVAEGYSMDESPSDGGVARFSIDFIQSEAVKYPEQVANPITTVSNNGQTAIAKVAVIADENMVVSGLPSSVIDNCVNSIAAIANQMILEGKNISRTKDAVVGIAGKVNEIDEYLKEVNRLVNQANNYANRPATLVYQIENIVSRVPKIVDVAMNAVRSYVRTFGFVFDYFGSQSWLGTVTGYASMENAKNLRDMTLTSIVSHASLSALEIEYETNQQAYDVRSSLVDMFDKLLNVISDDGLYESITDLKNSVITAIPPEGVRLQDVVYVDVNEPIPSLVFVNDQYGDVDNEEDFILRNRIKNPWIIPGGSIVEVLK